MNPIQKFKTWRDQRFQKRVLKALKAEIITNDGIHAILFNSDIVINPTIDADEIDEHDCGVPV